MTDQPNTETMRRLYDASTRGDADVLRELLGECVWHIPGEGILAGAYTGIDEILRLFARGAEETGGTLSLEIHDILSDGEHAIGLDRVTGRRGNRTIDMNRVVIAHGRDGKISEVWLVPEDQYGFDEFWS